MTSKNADPLIWVLTSGRRGDIVQCEAVGRALSSNIRFVELNPIGLSKLTAPWGLINADDIKSLPHPFPGIIIAASRHAVLPAKHVYKETAGKTKIVFLKHPGREVSDFALTWHPSHDKKRNRISIETLLAPHLLNEVVLNECRENIEPRISSLPGPRLGVILGGNSKKVTYTKSDIERLIDPLKKQTGFGSLLITGSRRTPKELLDALYQGTSLPKFIWDGTGDNPYFQILANSDAFLVTGDSHNMVGEVLAAGCKTYVFNPESNAEKFNWTLNELQQSGHISFDCSKMMPGTQDPLDHTNEIVQLIKQHFQL